MMRTSTCLFRFPALLLCVIFLLYLVSSISTSLSDISLHLASISERVKDLPIALSSTRTTVPLVPLSKTPSQTSVNKNQPSHDLELAHCINSFEQYPVLARRVLERKYMRYSKQTPAQRAISSKLGYAAHFDRVREGIDVNARLTEQIAQVAREHYHIGSQALEETGKGSDLGVVDLAFTHLWRDWSAQGAVERQAVFPAVLDALGQHFGTGTKENNKVLVPGSGAGRLASDIADLGYNVTANELDCGSIMAYRLLEKHTTLLHQHTLQPFVTKWAHQANTSSRYSALMVPEHWPNKEVKLVEGDFLEMFPHEGEFDAVVTLFFIDMSANIIDFLGNIHRLLKPGGVWINLGPLKWGAHTALELSVDEVLQLADLLDFDVAQASRKSIDSMFAAQPETLLKPTYVTQFWSATKRV